METRWLIISVCIVAGLGALAEDSTLDCVFEALPTYVMGDPQDGLERIRAEVNRVHGDAEARDAIERRLIGVLEGDSTRDAKRYVCRQLYVMGTARAVPALSELLFDPGTANEARYALERMDSPEAGTALRMALSKLQGKALAGVVTSLGVRKDPGAIAPLKALLDSKQLETALAAAEALSQIGTPAACEALRARLSDERPAMLHACEDGVLACAEELLVAGDELGAAAIYETLYAPDRRDAIRVAAFRGMIASRLDDAAALVQAALMGDDAPVAWAALRSIRNGEVSAHVVAAWIPDIPADRLALVIDALGDSGDSKAMPSLVAAIRRPADELVLHAALRALGRIGDKTAIPVLARVAATGSRDAADIARESLATLKGDDIDRVMVTAARAGSEDIRKVLLESLGERQATAFANDILRYVGNSGAHEVQQAALRALAELAPPVLLTDLVRVLVNAHNDDTQQEASRAIVQVAARAQGPAKTAPVLDAIENTTEGEYRAALISVLGRIGHPSGLDAIRAALSDPEERVRASAIHALASWPERTVAPDLKVLAAQLDGAAERDLAFEGYIRLIRADAERDPDAAVESFREALGLARGAAQLRMIMAGIAEIPDLRAAELVRPYLDHSDVHAEARIAYNRIRRSRYQATASHNAEHAYYAIDNEPATRWDTSAVQSPGQWFQVDLMEPVAIMRIALDTSRSRADFPRAFDVYIALDPDQWGEPVVHGYGAEGVTTIDLPGSTGRYVRIVQTGSSSANLWSIHELMVETE